MLWFLKKTWVALGAFLTLLGILAIPTDTETAPAAIGSWMSVIRMIDREVAITAFSIAALFYIIWIDLRPFIEKWWRGDKRELTVHSSLACDSSPFQGEDGEEYFINQVYVIVYNNGRSKKTAMETRAWANHFDGALALSTISGEKQIDLHHGESARFMVGYLVAKAAFGMPAAQNKMPSDVDLMEVKHNLPNGNFVFRIGDRQGYFISTKPPFSGSAMEALVITISARDNPTTAVKIDADVERLTLAYNYIVNPMVITSISQS